MRSPTVLRLVLLVLVGCSQAKSRSELPNQRDQRGAGAPSGAAERTQHKGGLTPIRVTGFETPESVLHDSVSDLYLVSNISGSPLAKDDNGFISRVEPNGTISDRQWISGVSDGITLHAPKGMALSGDTLYVADIDTVRLFERETGAPKGEIAISGASFLNDLVVDESAADGKAVYVSDTGVKEKFAPAGTDAIYVIQGGQVRTLVRGTQLGQPNGLALRGGHLWAVSFGSNLLYRITRSGRLESVTELPQGGLDGLVTLPGGFLVSSWRARAIYGGSARGKFEVRVSDLVSPADIGWDSQRQRVLVPLFEKNAVEIHPIALPIALHHEP